MLREKRIKRNPARLLWVIDFVETNSILKTLNRKQNEEKSLDRKGKYVPDFGDRINVEDLDESEEAVKKRKTSTSRGITVRMKAARQALAPSDDSILSNCEVLDAVELEPQATEAGDLLHDPDETGETLSEETGEEDVISGEKVTSKKRDVKTNKMPIPNTAAASVRFGTSQAETAAITSGFLLDLIEAGHLAPEKAFLAVNKNKVSRAKDSVMKLAGERGEKATKDDQITAVYSDGRKDKTKVCLHYYFKTQNY